MSKKPVPKAPRSILVDHHGREIPIESYYTIETADPLLFAPTEIPYFYAGGGAFEQPAEVLQLQGEIANLRSEMNDKAKALRNEQLSAAQKADQLRSLNSDFAALKEKESLNHLLHRVGESAQARILSDPAFRAQFSNGEPCDAFVVSIDIRRSTELMLKAREPREFAAFIIGLAGKMRQCMLDHYGVFDKFTGDGILAFFPRFFSGEDAGYRAVTAALACHRIFAEHYASHRGCFLAVLRDTGLGIGIDFGHVHIVSIAADVSVVGTPVVYACRMSGALAG